MPAIRKRLLALLAACVSVSTLAGPAGAQGKPDSTGFIGIPEFTSSETGIPFFASANANRIDAAFRDMRNAIVKCDRGAYDYAHKFLNGAVSQSSADDPTSSVSIRNLRIEQDAKSMAEATGKAPPFPADCVSKPEFTSTETGISFYFNGYRDLVDSAFKKMREAIKNCDRNAYEIALHNIVDQFDRFPLNRVPSAQDNADSQFLRDAVNRRPPFPEPCTPPSTGPPRYWGDRFGPFEFAAIGGVMVPLNSNGSVTGVDTFFGPGAFLIDNRSSTGGNATAFVGGRVRATPFEERVSPLSFPYLFGLTEPAEVASLKSFMVFLESGIQTAFGAQSSLQTFQNVSGTPQAFGSSTINENLQIPILAGVTLPIVSGGASKPSVLFDFYGGITLDSWTQTLQGRESGAPGGPGFFGQNRRFTVDPTIGVGVRVPVGDIGFGLPIIFGVNAELQFRPGSVVTAPSANFPSETYYGTVNPTANMAIMGRIGIPFGGR
jgi:hypothetical protein